MERTTEQEIKDVLFETLETDIKGAHKNAVWRKITTAVNSVVVDGRTSAEVLTIHTLNQRHLVLIHCLS